MASQSAVVVVNWNGAAFLQPLMESLEAQKPAEVVVVDNHSSDASTEIIARYPAAKAILNSCNAGFGSAANQGIEATQAPFILLLNADTRIQPGAMEILEHSLLENQDAAIAAPQLVSENGEIQKSLRRFPTVFRIFLYLSYLDRVIPSGYMLAPDEHLRAHSVEQPMGAALLFRRSALHQTGSFDPQFFMYMEEVDLCRRLHAAGWKIIFVPDAKVLHHEGGSSNQAWARTQTNYLESLLRFFKKHGTNFDLAALRFSIPVALMFRAVIQLFRGRLRAFAFYVRSAFCFPFLRI